MLDKEHRFYVQGAQGICTVQSTMASAFVHEDTLKGHWGPVAEQGPRDLCVPRSASTRLGLLNLFSRKNGGVIGPQGPHRY